MRKKVYQFVVLYEYGGGTVRTTEKYPSLEELQRIVDGYIEDVKLNRISRVVFGIKAVKK